MSAVPLVIGQALCICAVSIPLGLIIAALLSFLIVPAVMGLSTISTGTVISFSPWIFIDAALFSLLTTLLGAVKPAKKAANISPVEAQKFTGIETKKRAAYSFAHGKLYRMALRNIFRDRKQAAIVFLSLFLGITTFILIITLVASMNPDNFAAANAESNFVLTNTTTDPSNHVDPKQKFDDDFIDKVSKLPGFVSAQYDTTSEFFLTYTDDFQAHLESELNEKRKDGIIISDNEIADIKKNFKSHAIGVDGIISIIIPEISYRSVFKSTIVERLREMK